MKRELNQIFKLSARLPGRLLVPILLAAVTCIHLLPNENMLAENRVDPVDTLLVDALKLSNNGNEYQALELYQQILNREPGHYEALWNASLLLTRLGRQQKTGDQVLNYYNRARFVADQCLRHHPDKPRCHYTYGLALAGIVDEIPTSAQRIDYIWKVKEHGEKALESDPDYAPNWHLLGILHSKLSTLSRAEKLGARVLFGRLPEGSTAERAEEYLLKAIELDPNTILFHLDLAQHYQETGQPQNARPHLERALALESSHKFDDLNQEEARERLKAVQ